MRASSVLKFQQTGTQYLTRPWKKFRDGTLFYGQTKSGSRRHALTTKDGNKNYYKGTRSNGIGRLNDKGRYVFNWAKVRTFVVPKDFNPSLRPLVSPNAPQIKNTFAGYSKGPMDPNLYYTKLREYILYGKVESPEAALVEGYIERG